MEVDLNYQNGKIFKRNNNNYLPFVIDRIPKVLSNEHMTRMKSLDIYLQYDENQIYYNVLTSKDAREYIAKFYVVVTIVISIVIPLMFVLKYGSETSIYVYTSLIVIGLLFLIPAYLNWQKSKRLPKRTAVIFDRRSSIITLPKLDPNESFRIQFEHLMAARINIGYSMYQAAKKPQLIFYNEPNKKVSDDGHIDMTMHIYHDDAQETWSYYVWYMDKYRPLPPGQAFDPYRQQDFERRRAEGFPAPFYTSVVPTPEATPEQQLEREKFWKDEDHMVDASEAKFSLLAGAFSEEKRKNMKEKKRKKSTKKKHNGN